MHVRTLALIPVVVMLAASRATSQAYFYEIQAWVTQDALNPPPDDALLFVGSSSIRRWETLTRDFSEYDVIQRGFGGSQFADLNNYVSQIVLPYDPLAIMVLEGTNDTAAGKSATTVFQDYLQFVQLVHSGQNQSRPPIPIFFIGIIPTPSRWPIWSVQDQVNQLVQNHASTDPALHYIDVPTPFLATGQPPAASLFVADRLHPNASGYALFLSAIRAAVSPIIPSPRVFRPNPSHPPVGARVLLDLGPSNAQDGAPTASPDANGNHWNNWHPVNGSGDGILAGQSLGNLVTTTGSPTGIDFVITGGFGSNGIVHGGLLTPTPGLLGALAIATATQDYFSCTNFGSPGGFALTGLDPLYEYSLRAFATCDSTETRITRFTAETAAGLLASADLQTSGIGAGSAGNGNDDDMATLARLQPDGFGQLFVDVERIAGSLAYLGILDLEVTDRIHDLGPGCGASPLRLACNHPRINAAWRFAGSQLQPGTFTAVVASLGQPVPTPLPPTGCTAFVELAAYNHLTLFTGIASVAGEWTGSLSIPDAPGLGGTVVTVQLGTVTSGAGSGFDLSNGLRATVRN